MTASSSSHPAPTRRPGGMAELLAIAMPMVISQACETVMMVTDRLYLSRLGPEYMSAALGGGLTAFMFMTFFFGLTGYANAMVAQRLGAERPRECGLVLTQALLVCAVAVPFLIAAIPAGRALFQWMKPDPAQLPHQIAYFELLMVGMVLGLLRHTLGCFFSGIGRTRVVMVAAGVTMLVNMAANYVLIFGAFGAPEMGIRGAAIGTWMGNASGLVILAAVAYGSRVRHAFGVRTGLRFDRAVFRELLRRGTPSGAEFFLNLLAFDLLILAFQSYGADAAAAVTIAFNWDMVAFVPLMGVGIGVTSLVGRYMGAGQPDFAHQATMSGLRAALLYTGTIFLLFNFAPDALVRVYLPPDTAGPGEEAIAFLVGFMIRLISVYVFADSLTVVFSGALRGAGDTFWTMVLSVSGHWLMAGSALILIRVVGAGPRVTWPVVVCAVVFIGLTFLGRYRQGRWRTLRPLDLVPPDAVSPAVTSGLD